MILPGIYLFQCAPLATNQKLETALLPRNPSFPRYVLERPCKVMRKTYISRPDAEDYQAQQAKFEFHWSETFLH